MWKVSADETDDSEIPDEASAGLRDGAPSEPLHSFGPRPQWMRCRSRGPCKMAQAG